MHSFEVDVRISQPENSDVHRGEVISVTFEGVNRKRMHLLFCYMTLSLFLVYLKYFHIYKKKMFVAVFLCYISTGRVG